MQRKRPVKLPPCGRGGGSQVNNRGGSVGDSRGHVSDQFDLSTCLPASISRDEVRSFSEVLDKSLELPLGPFAGSVLGGASEWEVQTKDDILKEVRQHVQAQKPWREEYDDAVFERRRQAERLESADRGCLIILPDNRVRAMDTQISRRVRAQLLGEEEVPEPPSWAAQQRRQEESRPKGPKRVRNPWYLPPHTWFSNKAANDAGEGQTGSFPYDGQILRGESHATTTSGTTASGRGGGGGGSGAGGGQAAEEGGGELGGDGPHRLTQREKETLQIVEAYKQHIKGSRLPHFLQ